MTTATRTALSFYFFVSVILKAEVCCRKVFVTYERVWRKKLEKMEAKINGLTLIKTSVAFFAFSWMSTVFKFWIAAISSCPYFPSLVLLNFKLLFALGKCTHYLNIHFHITSFSQKMSWFIVLAESQMLTSLPLK